MKRKNSSYLVNMLLVLLVSAALTSTLLTVVPWPVMRPEISDRGVHTTALDAVRD
ncbi:hypothetical protein BCR37DRAFT_379808 [Protomyces lactucae-debilis]|uniref:Uncharacterized protein n=1 Tax=Protomyces lactucae-debilis TaxID=2754530 RepID=A0A1Y2FDA6_PROLT|nr:uncharacterized protein BCR37DRAFT_379808 [Protomyces lactucae-debilis]ORY81910.1 hypothetical protein BCR37DRAFT_379808 [Protomyces lactucae-debilis]